jgi:TRAP-type C4-dicarboxylate transport system permease large subunit
MTVIMIEIGFMTPPVGLCVYVLKSVSDASLVDIFRSIFPFVVMWLVGVLIMTFFPEIALFLPRIMVGP